MKMKLKDGTTGVSYQGVPLEIDAQGCVDVEAHVARELESHGHKLHVATPKKVRVRVPPVPPPVAPPVDGDNDGDDGDDHEGDGEAAGDDGDDGE